MMLHVANLSNVQMAKVAKVFKSTLKSLKVKSHQSHSLKSDAFPSGAVNGAKLSKDGHKIVKRALNILNT
jgi:hypothetical protein